VKIQNKNVGDGSPTYIVLEIARTYKNIAEAIEMIEIAAAAGADAIKIQSILAAELMIDNENTNDYYKMLEDLYRTEEQHQILKQACEKNNIHFLSTPEGEKMAAMLQSLDIPAFKISSLNLVNFELIKKIMSYDKPIIVSTGMGSISEMDAVKTLFEKNKQKHNLALLHCSSTYPTKPENCNLNNIALIKQRYDCIVGYSDHSIGITAPIIAVSMGASIIEKHFTLDRNQQGADHFVGVDEKMLREMVLRIRESELMLGSKNRNLCFDEQKMKIFKRRKIVTNKEIRRGDTLKKDDLSLLQTKSYEGIESTFFDDIVGKETVVDLPKNTIIEWKNIK